MKRPATITGTIHSTFKPLYVVVRLGGRARPRLGLKASYRGKEVGVVTDLIGNVVSPYAVVRVKDPGFFEEFRRGDPVHILVPARRAGIRGRRRRGRRGWAP